MSKKYDLTVVIGRFQPFHRGHQALVQKARDLGHQTLILIGSNNRPCEPKNPFSFQQRKAIVQTYFSSEVVHFAPLNDDRYDNVAWICQVNFQIQKMVKNTGANIKKVAIVGHDKTDTEYLKWFPQYALELVETSVQVDGVELNATLIRELLYNKITPTPKMIDHRILNIPGFDESIAKAAEEHHFIRKYKKQFETLPYPPTFVTVDAVVVCAGHVLLVKRKALPGRGLMAMPGGFLDQNETIEQGIIRELEEETGVRVDPSKIVHQRVFDHPNRSQRGRTVTHCGLIVLDLINGKLPKALGADDADPDGTGWYTIDAFYRMGGMFFDDHEEIISHMIRRLP